MQRCTEIGGPSSTRVGTLSGGGRWTLETPDDTNGTALLFSPGFGVGPAVPAMTAPTSELRAKLLSEGYTLAGATYPTAGWTVADGLAQQPELASLVRSLVPDIQTLIGWGHSMGGLVTIGLVEAQTAGLDAALVLCGSLAGGVAMLDQAFDAAFVLQTLLGDGERAIGLSDDSERMEAGARMLNAGASTPEGRARIALAAAVGQIPEWSVEGSARPSIEDVGSRAEQQRAVFLRSAFAPRDDIQARSGGNPSGNSDVDYRVQLAASGFAELVDAMYAASSATLEADLAQLAVAPRVTADADARDRLRAMLTPSGAISVPVAAMWCTGDVAPTLSQARAFEDAVVASGRSDLLRQFVSDHPGHLPSDAEIHTALAALIARLRDGTWPDDAQLDAPARFVELPNIPFLRPDRLVVA